MKYNNYISSRPLGLSLALIVTLLAQVNTSNGLDCYACMFVENNGGGLGIPSSATCEKNPTAAELVPVTPASLAKSAAALQVLKGLSSISSTNLVKLDNAIASINGSLATDATDLWYCTLSTFNLDGYGRIIMRLAALAFKDLGETYCDNTLPGGTDFDLLPIKNVENCYCRVSGCNGKPITGGGDGGDGGGGADKAGQSIASLVFSIGIAILAFISFGQ